MCSPVSLQLVTPGEPLSAEHPVADEGSLSAVPAKVGPEVRRLPVHLATTSNVAYMLLLLPHTRTPARHEGMKGEPPRSQQIWTFWRSSPDLPPDSLQLGQVQATLRSLLPSLCISMSPSPIMFRLLRSLGFSVESPLSCHSSESGSSLM